MLVNKLLKLHVDFSIFNTKGALLNRVSSIRADNYVRKITVCLSVRPFFRLPFTLFLSLSV